MAGRGGVFSSFGGVLTPKRKPPSPLRRGGFDAAGRRGRSREGTKQNEYVNKENTSMEGVGRLRAEKRARALLQRARRADAAETEVAPPRRVKRAAYTTGAPMKSPVVWRGAGHSSPSPEVAAMAPVAVSTANVVSPHTEGSVLPAARATSLPTLEHVYARGAALATR